MATEDAQVAGTESTGGFDELALLDGHDLSANQTRVAYPAGDGEGQNQVEEAGAEEGDEGDGEQDAGQSKEGVDQIEVDGGVDPSAVEASERAGNHAHGQRERDDRDGDDQRDARAVEGAGEDVSA